MQIVPALLANVIFEKKLISRVYTILHGVGNQELKQMAYQSSNIMKPTGLVVKRNQRDSVSNLQENSPIIDEVPLEDPTDDETIQTQTNNVPIAINCNVKDNITRSGRISQPPV